MGCGLSTVHPVEQLKRQRVVGLAAPAGQSFQHLAQLRIRLPFGLQDPHQAFGPPGEGLDLGFEGRFVRAQGFQALLLVAVDLALFGPAVAGHYQVEPDQEFEVGRAEQFLHGQPAVAVDRLAAGRQTHEEVIAQQVALAESDTGVVDRLEDPVDVVALVRGDLDDRQQTAQYGLHRVRPRLTTALLTLGQRGEEEPVGGAHVAGTARLG